MKIDNNYTQRQQNFGSLKSIKYCNDFHKTYYAKEIAELLQAIKESKPLNEFFKKYDVDMFISCKIKNDEPSSANLTLKTSIQKTKDKNLYPELKIEVLEDQILWSESALFYKLTQSIKKLEFSDLKNKLDNSLKQLEDSKQDEKVNAMYRTKIDDITNSLLTQDSSEVPKKKTFFEKLFGWLK